MLKLRQKNKANHFNKCFQDKLNIFKIREGIRDREIINISKKGSNNINCIQIGRMTISNSSDIANEFNRHFTSDAKQINRRKDKKSKTSLLQISEESKQQLGHSMVDHSMGVKSRILYSFKFLPWF